MCNAKVFDFFLEVLEVLAYALWGETERPSWQIFQLQRNHRISLTVTTLRVAKQHGGRCLSRAAEFLPRLGENKNHKLR